MNVTDCYEAVVGTISIAAWQISKLQLWRGPVVMFGDQHLETTVALVELHKIRYGR